MRLEDHQRQLDEIKETAKLAYGRATELNERIDGVIGWQKRQNGDIASAAVALNNMAVSLNEKIEKGNREINKLIGDLSGAIQGLSKARDAQVNAIQDAYDKRIDDVCKVVADNKLEAEKNVDKAKATLSEKIVNVERTLGNKFEENRNYFSRWFIGIMATLLTSAVIIIFSRYFMYSPDTTTHLPMILRTLLL